MPLDVLEANSDAPNELPPSSELIVLAFMMDAALFGSFATQGFALATASNKPILSGVMEGVEDMVF